MPVDVAADAEWFAVGVPEFQPVHHELHQWRHVIGVDDLFAPLEQVPLGSQHVRLGSAWVDDRNLAAMLVLQKLADLDQIIDRPRDVVWLALLLMVAALGKERL